jgi:two-component system, sensor histidine kinase
LTIDVVDNGIGLSKEAQQKIFKPFEQADSSTTRIYGGTGLGLSIVLNLIEQMRGKIILESEEGVGSRFKVVLPLENINSKEEILEHNEHTDDEKPILHGKILIAEDNKTNQMLISCLMDEFGLEYSIANDGVEAVDMFGKDTYDLVLMDENMPNLGGCDAMKKIHSLYGFEVPIIALTANAMEGDKEMFLEAGMNDYIAKPLDDNLLYEVIKKWLER